MHAEELTSSTRNAPWKLFVEGCGVMQQYVLRLNSSAVSMSMRSFEQWFIYLELAVHILLGCTHPHRYRVLHCYVDHYRYPYRP